MNFFSYDKDSDENIGELVLDTLLSSNIDTITDLNLGGNESWFWNLATKQERLENVDLLAALISKQDAIHHISLNRNFFSRSATKKVLTRIAEHPSTRSKLQTLNLEESTNLEENETVETLVGIFVLTLRLKKCNITNLKGSRKVKVQIEYASEEGIGSIVVMDVMSNLICRKDTDKTEA